jgi:hypothetical protein
MLLSDLRSNFDSIPRVLSERILSATEGVMRAGSSNTSSIARELSRINGKSFKTNDMQLYRLLLHPSFQVDDTLWRGYVGSIFDVLAEQGHICKGDELLIALDFTSDCNDFLILFASLVVDTLTIPLYFSMRNYPRRKNQMDQKKMELAFIKALKHVLSKKYRYILIADRGFGNDRFIGYCLDAAFDVMIRIEPNMLVNNGSKAGIASDILREDGVYFCEITGWKKSYHIVRQTAENKTWYILTNMNKDRSLEASEVYKKRFRIEKVFQNLKSSGFDIEASKIRKYDRFKRMLFISCFAYSMLLLIGAFVDTKLVAVKKNSPRSTNLLIASLNSVFSRLPITQNGHALA